MATVARGIAGERVTLEGFARAARSPAIRVRPRDPADVSALLHAAGPRGIIARGLGRSYGDAALNRDGCVADTTELDGIVGLDEERRTITAQAGTSLGSLLGLLAPRGWTLPVVPATRHVTVGGAIAADVHGKNHVRAGTIGRHIDRFVLHTPAGVFDVTPRSDPELFFATTGGMGLTGIITEATLRIEPAGSTWVQAETICAGDLDALLAALDDAARRRTYAIGWIDSFASGAALGRGYVVGADPAAPGQIPPRHQDRSRDFRPRSWGRIPATVPAWLLSDSLVALTNRAWLLRAYRSPPRHVGADAVLMPLDAVGRWNHLYGNPGFVQYQFAVPDRAAGTLRSVMERLASVGCHSYFTTMKRLGPANDAPLSFPLAGWTLSLDIPARHAHLEPVLRELDALVAGVDGRVYLAKDARMRPDVMRAMYPAAGRLAAVRSRVDPAAVLQSDLSRRLGLT